MTPLIETSPTHAAPSAPPAPTAPRRRRRLPVTIALVAVAALLMSACLNGTQYSAYKLMNRDRMASGARALPTHRDAQSKAQAWANRLARENRLYHSTLSSGIRSRWCALGENVGYATSVAGVESAFMRSAAHKSNIVNRTYNGVGVGVARNGGRYFVVQVFIKAC